MNEEIDIVGGIRNLRPRVADLLKEKEYVVVRVKNQKGRKRWAIRNEDGFFARSYHAAPLYPSNVNGATKFRSRWFAQHAINRARRAQAAVTWGEFDE